ncbi:hypothetical protein GVK96_13665 [Enterococcus hirae]|uniref:WxL domain-containing protein n=1 Tax=Enterococcus hirae TaxID=1354 RepID=UPI001378B3D0|nr:WxL domain-containing protein [Enterococcus hirae]EMF0396296.1 WxL domain-containing protein [Enterococcus hirae]NBA40486.1 hypothetical protein [Enterococcus hirae]
MKKQALVAAFSLVAPMVLGSTGVFADTTLTSSSTSVNANFTLPAVDNDNPTPNNPSGGSGTGSDNNTNLPLNPDGSFGLAYVPYGLDFGTIELNNSGSMSKNIDLPAGETLNVGVKDTLHNSQGWTLSAQFTGQLANEGATIGTTTNKAQVYDASGHLQDLSNPSMIDVVSNAAINSSQQVIMTGNQGNVFSGTYDMNLGTVSLEIPDASRISQGQATGSITWNLAQTPQNP